jgi:hypothetical protein
MTDNSAKPRHAEQAIAVVTNKSWYEGFAPLFIYFAQRACPDADILVFTMGEVDPLIPETLNALNCDPNRYRLIPNFGMTFGDSPLASKTSRWVIPLEHAAQGYETLYVGDIDILMTREPHYDLFEQHMAHSKQLGIPISNMVRLNSERLTGLHFTYLPEYLARAETPLRVLRDLLISTRDNPEVLASHFPNPGGDEKALYSVVCKAEPDWVSTLKTAHFRPHHGVHLGLFRNEGRLGSVLLEAIRGDDSDMPRYWNDVAPKLSETIASDLWVDLFAAYPRVETACRQFLEFYRIWRSGEFDASNYPS